MPLALHIYTAAKQWDAHNTASLSLDMFSIISIEDYQRNLEAIYSENPTSMGYSGNKVTTALYPICVEYLGEDGTLKKGAIAFLTDDKIHDHQQARDECSKSCTEEQHSLTDVRDARRRLAIKSAAKILRNPIDGSPHVVEVDESMFQLAQRGG